MPRVKYVTKRFSASSLAIVEQANAICTEYAAQGFDLTLRQLYYQFVSRAIIPNRDTEYKRLGSIINDARLAGLLDWTYIVDRTRNLRADPHWTDPADIIEAAAQSFRIDKWANQPYRPEVWIEKDALIGVIEGVCQRNDVPYFSCRGYTSQSEVWAAAQRLNRYRRQRKAPIILHLGDHDPSGIDMTRDITDRLTLFMGGVPVQRLALNWDQVEQYNPPPNPAKLALALDTPLPTPTGWTTMGDVQLGDRLFGLNGQPYPVTGKSPVLLNSPCLEFTFSGGCRIVCTDDHLWTVAGRKRVGGTMTAARIAATWSEGAAYRPVYRIPVAAPLEASNAELPIPPYVLGAWLGDGNANAEGFACGLADDELLDHIRAEGFSVRRKPSYPMSCTVYGLRGKLYALGVANNKHIPTVYLRASYPQRLALLQGLMDTDGSASVNRSMVECFYASSRQVLAAQVLELLCSLGIRARIHESRAMLNGRDYGPTWRVHFYPGDLDVFRLSRKREKLRGVIVAPRQRWRTILGIRRVERRSTQCVEIASPDHLYLAGDQFIATHNTDSRATGYLDRFGESSWELDALEPTVLAALIQDALDGIKDLDLWDAALADEERGRAALRVAATHWDVVTEFLADEPEEDA